LGLAYEQGQGVEADASKAVSWYRQAAKLGHPRARYKLGLAYELGKGVSADEAQALKWYGLAASQGVPAAKQRLETWQP
jgi:hypothetical protein